jgi:hypothetical protein
MRCLKLLKELVISLPYYALRVYNGLKIFGVQQRSPKRDEVTGDWRKLHNEELHNLYSSPNIIRMIMQSCAMQSALDVRYTFPDMSC